MTPQARTTRIVVAVSTALLAAYAILWAPLTPFDIGRSDFTAFYVGGTLLREGHGAALYDESLQGPLHAQLIAPDREGNLPFVDPPVAAALVAPVTLLGLGSAYRLWALVELAVLAAAVAIAVAAVPPEKGLSGMWRWSAGLAAMAGAGTLFALSQAQWTPVLALGLAVAFWCWQRIPDAVVGQRPPISRRAVLGGAALVASALVGKPQLALGLIAFMAGWRRRDVLFGAAAGLAGFALVSVAIAGPSGIAGFVRIVSGSTIRWDPHLMLGVSGVAAALTGGGPAAFALGCALAVVACAGAYVLGRRVRRDPSRLPLALAGAAAFSLFAAPHAYLDDLALLAPVAAWCLAGAGTAHSQAGAGWWRARWAMAPALWMAVNGSAIVDLGAQGHLPAGPATAFVLAAAGAVALAATRGRAALPLRYRAEDEAALGAVAHGLRRW
ncbi:MAG: DUF2029 domain-containing protein [Candidatus Dormibacteraeota bacterium]|nr:DUF2029 domain-containing protein [Candidatus Dormibacteraeota bacterium]